MLKTLILSAALCSLAGCRLDPKPDTAEPSDSMTSDDTGCDSAMCDTALPCFEETAPLWFSDLDLDGFGVDIPGSSQRSCAQPGEYWALSSGDCNDNDATIYPGAPDAPSDGVDSDCDGFD